MTPTQPPALDEQKFQVGDQWFYRGNRSPRWFATHKEGGGLSDPVESYIWPLLEEIAKLRALSRQDGVWVPREINQSGTEILRAIPADMRAPLFQTITSLCESACQADRLLNERDVCHRQLDYEHTRATRFFIALTEISEVCPQMANSLACELVEIAKQALLRPAAGEGK